MSRQGHHLPNVSIQTADIDSQLNASALGIFMMGMYTIVYFGTMFICLQRKSSQGKPVILTISLLYVFALIECIFEWVFLHWFFIANGSNVETTFVSHSGCSFWLMGCCWARAFRVILVPLFLFVGEIALFLSALIILFIKHAHPSRSEALTINRLESAGYLVSATASLSATFRIAYRIASLSKHGLSASKARFYKVIEIVVQSVLVYSLALVVQAVAVVVPFSIRNDRLFALEVYSSAILIPIAGIAPTVMVACVTLSWTANADRQDFWPGSMHTSRRKATTLRFRTDRTSILGVGEHELTRVIDICVDANDDVEDAEKNVNVPRDQVA